MPDRPQSPPEPAPQPQEPQEPPEPPAEPQSPQEPPEQDRPAPGTVRPGRPQET